MRGSVDVKNGLPVHPRCNWNEDLSVGGPVEHLGGRGNFGLVQEGVCSLLEVLLCNGRVRLTASLKITSFGNDLGERERG